MLIKNIQEKKVIMEVYYTKMIRMMKYLVNQIEIYVIKLITNKSNIYLLINKVYKNMINLKRYNKTYMVNMKDNKV